MMRRTYAFFVCGLIWNMHSMSLSWFARDRAAYKTQQEEWQESKDMLQKLLVKKPEDPEILSGLGVTTYKLGEYDHAAAYFASAIEKATDATQKEWAYFNYGNTLVAQKKLQDAVDAYEHALKLNSHNEQAQHNLEVVKKMLQNQQQNDQQNNQDKKDQDKSQDQQNKNDQQEQQDQNKQDDQQENNKDQSSKDQQSSGEQKKEGNQDQQDSQRDSHQDEQQEDKPQDGNSEQESQQDEQSQHESGEDSRDEPQHDDSKDKGEDKDGNHDESPQDGDDQKSSLGNDTQEEEKEQDGAVAASSVDDAFKELDARLAQLLEAQEQKDADLSKHITKMHVDKQLAGQDGQNRW